MEEAVHIGLLYEIYGFALTKTQQSLCEAYYYDDLSLSEIAELRAISKQAVSTQIARAVKKMSFLEEHLRILETEKRAQEALPVLKEALHSEDTTLRLKAQDALKHLSASLERTRDRDEGGMHV